LVDAAQAQVTRLASEADEADRKVKELKRKGTNLDDDDGYQEAMEDLAMATGKLAAAEEKRNKAEAKRKEAGDAYAVALNPHAASSSGAPMSHMPAYGAGGSGPAPIVDSVQSCRWAGSGQQGENM